MVEPKEEPKTGNATGADIQRHLVSALRAIPAEESEAWLQIFYENYTQRFLADNERIWSVGAILIPVSLAGFAAIATIDTVTRPKILILAVASIAIYGSWALVAEHHRAFQTRSQVWISAIEELKGITGVVPDKVFETGAKQNLGTNGAIKKLRWCALLPLLVIWGFVYWLWPV